MARALAKMGGGRDNKRMIFASFNHRHGSQNGDRM